ncbi:uncharacterized protein LOC130914243 [Corythoichthys intestinalis]|uniref:uncharacterized protein LOC130914243 n=1 Tax=Corythoichthys intestinalis TaxID=161448 RepID=UPI0025A55FB7|nr:uncharacterized protein LOC130914243 [Corythoichthys intestinalis]
MSSGWRTCEKAALWTWLSLLSVAVALTATALVLVVFIGVPAYRSRQGAMSTESKHSYIQMMKSSNQDPWKPVPPRCDNCTLTLRNDSLHFGKDGVYFLYAQVTFAPRSAPDSAEKPRSVTVTRAATADKSARKLAEASYPHAADHGSLWVGTMARLQEGDRVNVRIDGDFMSDDTFWGAFEIRLLAETSSQSGLFTLEKLFSK